VGATPAGPVSLGFLTVLQEGGGYLGGYLVTNAWGRPLEFRLTSAVQPNRVQQVLYASTLVPYVCADLIGKALVDRAGVPAHLIVTDREPVLGLREKVETPVAWLLPQTDARAEDLREAGRAVPLARGGGLLACHARHPADVESVRALLEQLDGAFDLAEPFARIREAVAEARKLGVTYRAAA
jgi:hypothetical protein